MRLLIVVSVTLLSACATSASLQALESANKSFKEYEEAIADITFDPIEHSGPTTAASDAIADSRWVTAWPACEAEMFRALTPKSVPSLIESELIGCLNRHRLKAKINILMGGAVMPFSKYLEDFFKVGSLRNEHKAQVDEERAESAGMILMIFAGALAGAANSHTNASLVNVTPYQKNNGTYVQPHVRTAPNSTCIDNLRGCR